MSLTTLFRSILSVTKFRTTNKMVPRYYPRTPIRSFPNILKRTRRFFSGSSSRRGSSSSAHSLLSPPPVCVCVSLAGIFSGGGGQATGKFLFLLSAGRWILVGGRRLGDNAIWYNSEAAGRFLLSLKNRAIGVDHWMFNFRMIKYIFITVGYVTV